MSDEHLQQHQRSFQIGLMVLFLTIVVIMAAGTYLFKTLEGWSWLNAFYFTAMTTTTVGYGDFTPATTLGKLATAFYAMLIIPFILYGFSLIAKYNVEHVAHKIRTLEHREKTQEQVNVRQDIQLSKQEKEIVMTEKELKKTEKELIRLKKRKK